MSTNWNYQTKAVEAATWLRSWRQEFFTDYNSDFTFVAHLEEITVDEAGNRLASEGRGTVTRKASQVMADPDVQALNELMTKLVKRWADEDAEAAMAAMEVPPAMEPAPVVVPPAVPDEPAN